MVNDTFGHASGDQFLIEVAGRLRASVRSEYRMGGASVVARVGGDEFAVLLDELRCDADAVTVAERILKTFDTPFEIGRRIFASISVGVVRIRAEPLPSKCSAQCRQPPCAVAKRSQG